MKDDPDVQCLPSGPRRMINGNFAKFVQTPSLLVILYEALVYRQVFLDGRALETDPNPSWMGYSVGRWEGDTLVVETAGYNDRTWLDESGHPHTEALRTTERFTRPDFGHMDVQVTYNDPKTYTRPWSVSFTADLRPDTELLEEVCAENNRSPAHIVGRTSEEKKVTVGPDVLARYAGTYAVVSTTDPNHVVTAYRFRISEGRLMMDIDGSRQHADDPLDRIDLRLARRRNLRIRQGLARQHHSYADVWRGDLQKGGAKIAGTKTKGDLEHPVFLPDRRQFLYNSLTRTSEQTGKWVFARTHC